MGREAAQRGSSIKLVAYMRDSGNVLQDADSLPLVEIRDPTGTSIESGNATKEDVGIYYYNYDVAFDATLGTWNDYWTATINGVDVSTTLSFVVVTPNISGYTPKWTSKARVVRYTDPQITVSDIDDFTMEEAETLMEDMMWEYGYDPDVVYNNINSYRATRRLTMAATFFVMHYLRIQGKIFYHSHVVVQSDVGGGMMPPRPFERGLGTFPPQEEPTGNYLQKGRRELMRFAEANDPRFDEMYVENNIDPVKEAYGEIYYQETDWIG
ncbi:MAG: hypothetical protein ACTSRA_00355 [Promethearchaeota archaeon]|nr:MAG: hypothetical protein [Helarchaeota virus Nidhogg Meg22_1012]URC17406.1 MAG: hypothetical protein [Helarchaeota virus Nidhogg Meg22_1214]